MNDPRIIAVVGATGAQGGGLANAILDDSDGGFRLRAITRIPDGERARALAARGAEVVAADLDDADSMHRAFEGAYGAFCLTNFWEHFSPEKEMTQARTMAEAAHATGVRHVIWSTLEDTRDLVPLTDDRMPTLMGEYKVPHLDAKGASNRFFSELGVPVTFLYTSFYWDNYVSFGAGPQRGPDGALALAFPLGSARMSCIAAVDIGRCAYGILQGGAPYVGRAVGICSEQLTGHELAASLSRHLGEPVHYHDVPPEVYRSFGFPGADDLGNMFQFYRDFAEECCRMRDPSVARRLNPQLQSFEQWLGEHAKHIPIS